VGAWECCGEDSLPNVQLSFFKRLLQIRNGYMQFIVSVSRVSNLNHKKMGIETEKGSSMSPDSSLFVGK
jgi:hypothetical protein